MTWGIFFIAVLLFICLIANALILEYYKSKARGWTPVVIGVRNYFRDLLEKVKK